MALSRLSAINSKSFFKINPVVIFPLLLVKQQWKKFHYFIISQVNKFLKKAVRIHNEQRLIY